MRGTIIFYLICLVASTSIAQVVSYTPTLVCNLNDTVSESSGLLYVNQTLWTHNDSGGKNELYQIDTITGFIKRKVVIKNASNYDWEDLAQNTTHVFIGDFGNNYGNRTNLCVYRINKLDLLNTSLDSIMADTIKFHYPDQTVFTSTLNANNYDCEAFLFYNDSLHLFSKSWIALNTKHYVIPTIPGNYMAHLVDSFNVSGLITGADINSENHVALIGYKKVGFNYNCFAWLLFDYTSSHFFNNNKQRIELGVASTLGQTEGIVLKDDNTGYFSSEKINTGLSILPPQLYKFDFSSFYSTVSIEEVYGDDAFQIYPNPSLDVFTIKFPKINELSKIEMYNIIGELQLIKTIDSNSNEISIDGKFSKGVYFIKGISLTDKLLFTKKIIIQ